MVWAGSVLCAIGGSVIAINASHSGFAPERAKLTMPPIASSAFFGLTVLDYKNANPLLTFGTTRTWDAHPALDWAEVNSAAGQYNFAPLNSYITTNMSRGTQILYTFGRTPQQGLMAPDNALRQLSQHGTNTLPQ